MPNAKINGININYSVAGQGEPLIMIMGSALTKAVGADKYLSSRIIIE